MQFASVLRKFIIAHCAELERKYHTVTAKLVHLTFSPSFSLSPLSPSQAPQGVAEEAECEWWRCGGGKLDRR